MQMSDTVNGWWVLHGEIGSGKKPSAGVCGVFCSGVEAAYTQYSPDTSKQRLFCRQHIVKCKGIGSTLGLSWTDNVALYV